MRFEWPERIWARGERGWTSHPVTPDERAARQYVENFRRDHGRLPKYRDPKNHDKNLEALNT